MYLDSRDLIEYAEDEDNQRDDPETVAEILALAEDGIEDWEYGAQFIREDAFQEYAQELAEEVGAYDPTGVAWPLTCIDWQQAARELSQDYTSVTFLGRDYYVRA